MAPGRRVRAPENVPRAAAWTAAFSSRRRPLVDEPHLHRVARARTRAPRLAPRLRARHPTEQLARRVADRADDRDHGVGDGTGPANRRSRRAASRVDVCAAILLCRSPLRHAQNCARPWATPSSSTSRRVAGDAYDADAWVRCSRRRAARASVFRPVFERCAATYSPSPGVWRQWIDAELRRQLQPAESSSAAASSPSYLELQLYLVPARRGRRRRRCSRRTSCSSR